MPDQISTVYIPQVIFHTVLNDLLYIDSSITDIFCIESNCLVSHRVEAMMGHLNRYIYRSQGLNDLKKIFKADTHKQIS